MRSYLVLILILGILVSVIGCGMSNNMCYDYVKLEYPDCETSRIDDFRYLVKTPTGEILYVCSRSVFSPKPSKAKDVEWESSFSSTATQIICFSYGF